MQEAAALAELGMCRAAMAQATKVPTWLEDAIFVIKTVAENHPTVHVDDVAFAADTLGLAKPANANAWGSAWCQAIKRGYIVRSGEMKSAGSAYKAHTHKHYRLYPVYRSKLFASAPQPKPAPKDSPVADALPNPFEQPKVKRLVAIPAGQNSLFG